MRVVVVWLYAFEMKMHLDVDWGMRMLYVIKNEWENKMGDILVLQINNCMSFLKHPSKSRLSLLIIEIIAFKDRQFFLIIIWHNSNKSEKILIFSQIGNAKILLIVDGSSTCPYLLVLSMFASSNILFLNVIFWPDWRILALFKV